MAPAVHAFMQQASGSRIRTFDVKGVKVSIESPDVEHDLHAEALAAKLANFSAGIERTWTEIEARAERAISKQREAEYRAQIAEGKVPPKSPDRLIGVGCVRFDDVGRLYLLNGREKGWASFGVLVEGWDDLFRRYAVKVIGHGTDEHGTWWEVVS